MTGVACILAKMSVNFKGKMMIISAFKGYL